MKNFVITLSVILFLNFTSASQNIDSLKSIYNSSTIYRAGGSFIKGDSRLSLRELSTEFTSPETQKLYFKSKSNLTTGAIFNVASLGLAIFSTLTSHRQSTNIELGVGTGILGLIGIIFHTHSAKLMDKAIWIRNRETLFNISH